MGVGQIGYQSANELAPRVQFQQPGATANQAVARMFVTQPVVLAAGQSLVLPPGQWLVRPGRYTELQFFDTNGLIWRNYSTQPGVQEFVSSDGTNYRLSNSTGCVIGAVIDAVGNANLTNGYNTVTVTVSAGNSTWGTLVGGTVNTTVTVNAGGNYSVAPYILWQPAGNQTFPFFAPTFTCNLNANGTINTVTVQYGGAGLTGAGTIVPVNQANDTNPGNGNLSLNGLTNSGNLVAMWPLTYGTAVTSRPTFTFSAGNATANAIMNWTVSNFTVATAGGNLGVSKPILVTTANGLTQVPAQCTAITGTDYGVGLAMPRPAWIQADSGANANGNSNVGVRVQDAGFHLQDVPTLMAIPSNSNAAAVTLPIYTAIVGGQTDTSYIQAQ